MLNFPAALAFVSLGIERYEEVAVEIVKSDFHKPFLGGFRHKVTGLEYHNAGTQTVPKKIPEKDNLFCRDTQVTFLILLFVYVYSHCILDDPLDFLLNCAPICTALGLTSLG